MLNNDEIQRIIADIESGAYDVADVLEAIANAAKGEDVRAALYAAVYATKNAQINGQPKAITEAENMKNPDIKYLYLGNEAGYDYGYVYANINGEWTKTTIYGEGKSPSVTVTPTATGVRLTVKDGHGTTMAEIENGTASDAQVETYVSEWLEEHPEATTTVEDESITESKLDPTILFKLNNVGITADIKDALLACFRHTIWTDADEDYYGALESALYPPANLVSISALYDPDGATIYNTNTLVDLKQYLTVTALYADLTTETVDNYILTGSMAAGTQTIMVTYGGKTTTFVATISERVTGISAEYTQSVTIYDTASLNDLKTDLVVTATLADSSTEIVPSSDYVLSGSLEEGTSTITVTYLGKTATFDVVVTLSALYPLVNGTHTFGDGSVLTITKGHHVKYECKGTYTSTTGNPLFNISDLTKLGTPINDVSSINNLSTLFSLPNGGGVVFSVDNASASSGEFEIQFNLRNAGGNTGVFSTAMSVTGESATKTQTISGTKNVGCVYAFFRKCYVDVTYEFDLSLLVNGTRYI